MSFQVTTAMIDQFSANVFHLSQQVESRLSSLCRSESQESESKFYDRIGKRSARRKEGRHSDVKHTDTPHSRRMVTMEDFYDSDLVDEEDKLRIIMNPESEYAMAIAASLGRQTDEVIIDAALGNAYGGRRGTEIVALPNTQKVGAFTSTALDTGAVGNKLNIQTLRAIRKKFKQAEAIKKGEKLIFVCAAAQMDDLLASVEVTSADFNSVKALVQGEVDTFMGFLFVETELLNFNEAAVLYNLDLGTIGAGAGTIAIGTGRRCIAMTANRGVLCAKGRNVKGRIDELPQKHHAKQVYGSLTLGATRMEEEQVVEVICLEL